LSESLGSGDLAGSGRQTLVDEELVDIVPGRPLVGLFASQLELRGQADFGTASQLAEDRPPLDHFLAPVRARTVERPVNGELRQRGWIADLLTSSLS
jgi:hypothetical protein